MNDGTPDLRANLAREVFQDGLDDGTLASEHACWCGKAYRSAAALWLHKKKKHPEGDQEDGQPDEGSTENEGAGG